MTIQELQDLIATYKFLKGERINKFLQRIDVDKSGTISAKECFAALLENVKIAYKPDEEKLTPESIEAIL